MTKTQSSIHSFFGAKKQPMTASTAEDDVITAAKENSENKPQAKKRRIIADGSDDDNEEEEEKTLDDKKNADATMTVVNESSVEETSPIQRATALEETTKAAVVEKTSPAPVADNKSEKANKSKESEESNDKLVSEKDLPPLPPPTELFRLARKNNDKLETDAQLQATTLAWNATRLPYAVVCQTLAEVEAITARLQIQQILTRLFRQILVSNHPHDLYTALYLASNSVAPACDNVELGIGDSLLIKAVAEATGSSRVKQLYEQAGDLGTVAAQCKSKQTTLGGFFTAKTKKTTTTVSGLSAQTVLQTFREIAQTKGNQSQKWKIDKIKKLLVSGQDPVELKYIVRGLQGKLRIGLAQSTVLISLAQALALTGRRVNGDQDDNIGNDTEHLSKGERLAEVVQYLDKSQTFEKRMEGAINIIKKAYSEVPSYDALLDAALKVPLEKLHKACTLTPGIPVSPMLAKPTKSVQEVLQRLNGQQFTCEYKYDGERAQIHLLPNGTTKVFSRNLLDTSEKYPEVPVFVKQAQSAEVQSYVMDAEVVAFKDGKLVPFQILSTRKKSEASAESAKVQIIVQAFDLMYFNGESLLGASLDHRRSLLRKHFKPIPSKFQFATHLDHTEDGDTTILEEFLDQAVKGCCEGLMVKTLDDVYEPSRRSLNWLKLKKDYLEGLGDSVDLVPLGAYHGRGKRTGVYGAYLLACYDPETEEFQSVCKLGTGFSEEVLRTLTTTLDQHKITTKSSQYNVTDQLECDVWFDAVQVWEVKAADLSKSSAHRGAVGKTGEADRGIGLRFPRFQRVRDDKCPEDATSSVQILDMYYQQDTVGGKNDDEDEDGI